MTSNSFVRDPEDSSHMTIAPTFKGCTPINYTYVATPCKADAVFANLMAVLEYTVGGHVVEQGGTFVCLYPKDGREGAIKIDGAMTEHLLKRNDLGRNERSLKDALASHKAFTGLKSWGHTEKVRQACLTA